MATTNIAADIQNITGVGTANAQFLVSAQKFVVASVPKNLLKWAATVTVPGNHGGNTSDGVKITMPIGTDSILDVSRNEFSATEVPYNMKGFIANTASLHLATETYPKYYLDSTNTNEGSIVIVKPIPTDSETAIVLYVDSTKIDDDCDLRNAVVFHASSSEFTKLSTSEMPTISISATSAALPSLPSISSPGVDTKTVFIAGTPPVYTAPAITTTGSDSTAVDLTKLDTASWTDLDYDFDDENIDPLKWFQVVGDYIQNQEDIELAQAQLQKIAAYVQAYGQAMQNQLNIFNDANVEYQASIQKAMQDAQIAAQEAQKEGDMTLQAAVQDYTLELQRFSADVQKYSADVQKGVSEYQFKLQKSGEYTRMATTYYQWAKTEVQQYIQNNSKMIDRTIAAQMAPQR